MHPVPRVQGQHSAPRKPVPAPSSAPGGQARALALEEESERRQRGCNKRGQCSVDGQCSWAEPQHRPMDAWGCPPALGWASVDKRWRGRCRSARWATAPAQPPGRALSWRAELGQTLWRSFQTPPPEPSAQAPVSSERALSSQQPRSQEAYVAAGKHKGVPKGQDVHEGPRYLLYGAHIMKMTLGRNWTESGLSE